MALMALMAFADSGPGAAEPFPPWIWGADAGKLFLAPAFLVCKEIGFSSQWEIGSLNAAAGKLQFSNCLRFLLVFFFHDIFHQPVGAVGMLHAQLRVGGGDPWGTEPTWVLSQHLHPPEGAGGAQSRLPRCPHTPGHRQELEPRPFTSPCHEMNCEAGNARKTPISSFLPRQLSPSPWGLQPPGFWATRATLPRAVGWELEPPRSPGMVRGMEFRAGAAAGGFLQQIESLLCSQCQPSPCWESRDREPGKGTRGVWEGTQGQRDKGTLGWPSPWWGQRWQLCQGQGWP